MVLSLAMTGLVLGGNVASMLMLAISPSEVWATFTSLVLTSTMTSTGLVLFCLYVIVTFLRETPDSAFIIDDVLIHLALVPGGLSLLVLLQARTMRRAADDRRCASVVTRAVSWKGSWPNPRCRPAKDSPAEKSAVETASPVTALNFPAFAE